MADLTSAATELVDSIVEMPGRFADVVTHDPVSGVLLALGALLVALPVAVLGYLTAGAVLSLFTVDTSPEPGH